jgi:hypothetical protein
LVERAVDIVLPAFPAEDCEPVAWLLEALGVALTWLWGMLAGLGLLGALACEALAALEALDDALPDEELGAALAAGAGAGVAGGGLLGALPLEECWANTAEENSKTIATTRPESRIMHLHQPNQVSVQALYFFGRCRPRKQ